MPILPRESEEWGGRLCDAFCMLLIAGCAVVWR
eukprot:SAG31_NODE_9831_length_1222_cov_1.345503_1_plen_32_part_10